MTQTSMLDEVLASIKKKYGDGAIMRMGDKEKRQIDVIPTGSIGLDIALGIGGVPRGRVTELYGSEASGKTTLALHIIANAQKAGGEVAFIDAEHTLDPIYAERIGVDVDKMFLSQPQSAEEALQITEDLINSDTMDVIVIDSVAALVPDAEAKGKMGDSHVGLQARLMSQAMRKITKWVARSHCVVLFINQIRMKIGITFGNPETTTGGRALQYYSSVRLDIRHTERIKNSDEEIIGTKTRVRVVKNKLSPPFRKAEFAIIHGEGISRELELIDLGSSCGVIDQRGSWYSYGDSKLGQGKKQATTALLEEPDMADKIESEIRTKLLEA